MQTKPRQRIPMPERMTDCSEPLKPQDAFLTARYAGVRGHCRRDDRCGRGGFGSPWALQSKKWIFLKHNLQTLPVVVAFAFVFYLKKAISALSFCVVDQYPIFAFLPRTKLQVIKSAPGWFLEGGNIASKMVCQENGIGLIANYTFQTDRAKEKYFIMQSSCSGPQTSEKKNNFLNIVKRTWHEASEQQTDLKCVVWVWQGVEREEKHPPVLPVQISAASPSSQSHIICVRPNMHQKIQQTTFHIALNWMWKQYLSQTRSMQITNFNANYFIRDFCKWWPM